MLEELVRVGDDAVEVAEELEADGAEELGPGDESTGQHLVGHARCHLIAEPDEVGDRRYLVAPRGTTQWVRNLRVAGTGQLRVGRRVEQFRAAELPEGDPKVTVLQAYLRRWSWEVGQFFDGVDVDDPAALARVASGYPVFAIEREA